MMDFILPMRSKAYASYSLEILRLKRNKRIKKVFDQFLNSP